MNTEEKFGLFAEDSTVELGKLVAVAADLPKGQAPDVGTVRVGQKRAFCYATTRSWKGWGNMPLKSDNPVLSRQAAGFMSAHECISAERALVSILREKGKTLSDLGRESWELALAGTYEEIVQSGRLCSEMEWEREFREQRERFPAGICVTLSLTEQDDGSYLAKAGVKLDCPHFGFARMCDLERNVNSLQDVKDLCREAVAHVFPWILSPEMGERIALRDGELIKKAIEERKDQNLPDIPRWIGEMADHLVKDVPNEGFHMKDEWSPKDEKPRQSVSMRM